jgi:hypothetical protein
MMSTTERFSVVDPTEENILSYKFGAGLEAGESLISPTVLVTVLFGADPNPQGIINGTPQISGTDVLIGFAGQLDGVDYDIKVTCTTSNPNKILALAKILPCRLQ